MCRNTMGRSLSTYALAFCALTLSACAEVTTAPDSVQLDQARADEAISSPEPQYVVSWMEDGEVVWHAITPVETAEPVEDFYKRGDPRQVAATTGYEVVDQSTLMLHRDTETGLVSLVVIYNALNNRPSDYTRQARAHLENWSSEAALPISAISFPVVDDATVPAEEPKLNHDGIWTTFNAWGAGFTDGWAARGAFEQPFSVQLRFRDMSGLTGIGWVDGDGERIAVSMEGAEIKILIGYGEVPADDPADDTPADDTPPVITATVTGDQNEDGWYTGDVAISWSVVDDESEISASTGCVDAAVTKDTNADGVTFTCEATSAGGTETESVTIKRDASPPVITASVSGEVGHNGWHIGEVSIAWTVADEHSAVSAHGCDEGTVIEDTGGIEFMCEASSAGGAASRSESIKRDATPPTIAFAGNMGTYDVDEEIEITCEVDDNVAGVAAVDCPGVNAPAWGFGSGKKDVEGSATDNAGNEAAGSTSFEVVPTAEGICALVDEWVANHGVANALCTKLTGNGNSNGNSNGNGSGNSGGSAGQLKAFVNHVNGVRGSWLTDEQADLLIEFAGTL